MKLFQIVITLTGVVVVSLFAVFYVAGETQPIIDKAAAEKANAAKIEVLPTLSEYPNEIVSNFDDYDVLDTGITDIFVVPDYGFVYMAEFQGYQSIIEYMIGINEDGEVTGYVTLQQNDTPGLGAEIGNPDNWAQFIGKSLTDIQSGNIDGLSGATVTTTGWKNSLAKVIDYHNNEMLGFEVLDVTDTLNLPSSITKVEVISDGVTNLEVVYTVEFTSTYSSGPNVYQVTIDLADGSVKKLVVLDATDSAGIGADFGAPEFAEQFKNMAQQDALDGNYDAQAGASYPITLSAFAETFEELIMTHKVEFEGYVAPVETEAERLIRLKEEISKEDAIFTDVTTDYTLAADSVITKIEKANDGTNDIALIITFEFTGYNTASPITAMVGINLSTDKVNGFRVISEQDTPGLGGEIDSEDFMAQFDNANILALQYGVFDALSGATVTTDALTDAFDGVISFYRAEILGEGGSTEEPLTPAQELQKHISDIFPDTFSNNDITANYTLKDGVTKVLEIKDIDGLLLGHVFIVDGPGAGYTTESNLDYIIAINANETFAGFVLLDDTETPGKATPFYENSFAELFVSVDINAADYGIDSVAGSTDTFNALIDSVKDVVAFYKAEVLEVAPVRPDPIAASDAMLLQGYPTAVSFNSIYLTLPYNELIGNVYEALDGSNQVIGYVYVGVADGNGGPIYFSWGVDNSGLTQEFAVLVENETWDSAPAYTLGEAFVSSTWLTHYEGKQMNTIISSPANIDAYAGVTNTTTGMVTAIEAIAQYHADNSVGGGS